MRSIDLGGAKPHLRQLYPGQWEAVQRHPKIHGVICVGSGRTAREAYDYATECTRQDLKGQQRWVNGR